MRITAPVNREVDPLDAHPKVEARYFRTNHLEKVDSLARDLQIAVKHHYPDCMQGKGRISPTVCGIKGGLVGGLATWPSRNATSSRCAATAREERANRHGRYDVEP